MGAKISVSRRTYDELVDALKCIGIFQRNGVISLNHVNIEIDLLSEFDEVTVKVLNIIASLYGAQVSALKLDMKLDSLGDSLDRVELAMSLEDEFHIPQIEDNQLEKLKTIQDVVQYVKECA